MKLHGTDTIAAPREQVWAALTDPAVLARTLPGCEQLEVVDDDTYRARVTAGVASIRGTYDGTVRLSERDEPSGLQLTLEGAGAPGTIGADVQVRLGDVDGATEVDWSADAVVGGMIGGVGQRMLAGASTRMASEFFAAIERDIVTGPADLTAEDVPSGEAVSGAAAGEPVSAAAAPVGTVFAGRGDRGAGDGESLRLLGAFVLGAAAALAGVLVGRRLR